MRNTGTLASAGVLISAGLFGAYVGNPRLQRAYASAPCSPARTVTDDTGLRTALDDSTVTCIEVSSTITLAGDLPSVLDASWVGGPREIDGLTIFGTGVGDDTIYGGGHGGIEVSLVASTRPVEVAMSDLTMSGFSRPYLNGGALRVVTNGGSPQDVTLDLAGVVFIDNNGNKGAAVAAESNAGAAVTVSSSEFNNNIANNSGGAFAVLADDTISVVVTDSTFTGNTGVNGTGGAIHVYADYAEAVLTVNESTFTGNFAKYSGGAIRVGSYSGDATIDATRSLFADDSTNAGPYNTGRGGALYINSYSGGAYASTNGSTFVNNQAVDGDGGAIALFAYTSGRATLDDSGSRFSMNAAGERGGAVSVRSDGGYVDASFVESMFIGNDASSRGGAVDLRQSYSDADVYLTRSTLSGNSVTNGDGGGIYSDGRAFVVGSSVIGNISGFIGYCTSTGGGIRTESDIYVTNSYVGNNAACRAGGIYAGGNTYLYFSTLYNNDALGVGSSEASAVYTNAGVRARGSAVGTSTGTAPLIVAPTIDDSYSISTSDDGDDSFVINLSPGSFGLGPLDDTVTAGQGGRSATTGSPLLQYAAPDDLGTGVVDDQLGVDRRLYPTYTVGARQLATAPPAPPNPPSPPSPMYPPGAPADARAIGGRGEATVTWSAPSYVGSFPITDYQVTSAPGSHTCLTQTTSCTVTGLMDGTSYTFTVRALNGAGWGAYSGPSNAVTPTAPNSPSILITGSRDANDDRYVKARGTTTDLVGRKVTPYVRFPGESGATAGTGVRTVGSDGTFTWQRKTGKKVYVYFEHDAVRSNTVVIPAR